jgi:hypothetical protein
MCDGLKTRRIPAPSKKTKACLVMIALQLLAEIKSGTGKITRLKSEII